MRHMVLLAIALVALPISARAETLDMQDQRTVALVEALLTELGYDPGPVDGLAGPRTAAAIGAYQRNSGVPVTAEISEEFVTQLMASALASRFADFRALNDSDLNQQISADGSAISEEMIDGMRSTGALGRK